jgi:lambda family phage tail tape measure protein
LALKLNDAAVATTVAATRLDQYRQAGEQVGVSFETIVGGLGKLNKTIAAAASGNQDAAKAFKDLGIAVTNNDGSIRATSDIFEELAQKIRAAPDNAAIFEQGTKIMGRGFASLLPLLEEGDEGMRKFQSRFSEEGIKNLDDFGDKLNRLGEAFKGMAASVTEVTVSGLLESVEFLNNTIGYTLRNAGLLEQQRQKMNYTPTFGKAPINNPQMSTVSGLMSPISGGDAEARFKALEAEKAAAQAAADKAAQAQRSYAAERQRQIAEEARALKQLAQERAREDERQRSAVSDFLASSREKEESLKFEISLIGKSVAEQEKMVMLRDIDNEAKQRSIDLSGQYAAQITAEAEATKARTTALLDDFRKKREDINVGIQEGFQDYLTDIQDRATAARDAVGNALRGVEDAFVTLATTGKLSFRDLADSIIADIARIAIRQSITGPLAGMLSGAFSGGGGASSGGGFGSFFASMAGSGGKAMSPSGFVNVTPNALGGIMTSDGSMPLNRYSMGGIANRPQLALFGEGRTPEAFVPLPDGRRIPVAMQGGGNTSVVVHVNVESGSQNVTSSGQNAEALGKTIAAAVRSTLISEKRPGGLLS